jgi:8-oxo-dGTP diphosphatase
MKPIKVLAKVALINEAGEMLMLRRSKTAPNRPLDLDLPGGKVEDGEDPLEAALREIHEEIGLSLKTNDLELLFTATNYYDGISFMRFLFVGRVNGRPEITLSHEHDQYKWRALGEVLQEFDHGVWSRGIAYLIEHDFIKEPSHLHTTI